MFVLSICDAVIAALNPLGPKKTYPKSKTQTSFLYCMGTRRECQSNCEWKCSAEVNKLISFNSFLAVSWFLGTIIEV